MGYFVLVLFNANCVFSIDLYFGWFDSVFVLWGKNVIDSTIQFDCCHDDITTPWSILSTQQSSEFYIDIPNSNRPIVATPICIIEWSNQFNKFERTVLTTIVRDEFIVVLPVLRSYRQSDSTILRALFLPTKYNKPSTLRHHQPSAISLVESTSRHLYTSSLQFRVTDK